MCFEPKPKNYRLEGEKELRNFFIKAFVFGVVTGIVLSILVHYYIFL